MGFKPNAATYPSVVEVPTLTNARFRPRIIRGEWRLTIIQDDNYQNVSEKGLPEGYAELDNNGLVPTAELGAGLAGAATFLCGDQTWKSVPSGSCKLLDGNLHTDTANTTPGVGALVYGNAFLQWDKLVAGSSGTYLRSSGATGIGWSSILVADFPVVVKNKVLIGPVSGGNAAPEFRLLAAADVGTGTPSGAKFLRDDMTWATVAGGIGPAGTDWSHVTNTTTDRTVDMDATTIDELADIVGTLIADLRTTGIIS